MKRVLILGGAGFIGSNLAEHFYNMSAIVTVVDGLLERTGGSSKNLNSLYGKIQVFFQKIEEIQNLQNLIIEADLIIDCIAWTSHFAAIENPLYDLELNCKSQLFLIENLKKTKGKNIILLSSRGIYGNVEDNIINENTPQNPIDIQGIHKSTAEKYFKFYSKIYNFNVLVLRIPNCFGKNQLLYGEDIGLVGSFIRDALLDNEIEIFGKDRNRAIIFVKDVINIIWSISQKQWNGFVSFNISGYNMSISELAEKIITIAGTGKISLKELPTRIKNIDAGNAFIDDSRLTEFIGKVNMNSIDDALVETINYFKENL